MSKLVLVCLILVGCEPKPQPKRTKPTKTYEVMLKNGKIINVRASDYWHGYDDYRYIFEDSLGRKIMEVTYPEYVKEI